MWFKRERMSSLEDAELRECSAFKTLWWLFIKEAYSSNKILLILFIFLFF